jgi:hypothetical protein
MNGTNGRNLKTSEIPNLCWETAAGRRSASRGANPKPIAGASWQPRRKPGLAVGSAMFLRSTKKKNGEAGKGFSGGWRWRWCLDSALDGWQHDKADCWTQPDVVQCGKTLDRCTRPQHWIGPPRPSQAERNRPTNIQTSLSNGKTSLPPYLTFKTIYLNSLTLL